jgi:hypothetical protein
MSYKFLKIYVKVKKWDRVTAKVISKKVELHKKYSNARSPYAVCVEYTYTYNIKDYTNHTVYLAELLNGQVNHMESSAKKVLNKIEDTPLIYVDPKNPENSVLFCNGLGLYILIAIMGLLSLLIGLSKVT